MVCEVTKAVLFTTHGNHRSRACKTASTRTTARWARENRGAAESSPVLVSGEDPGGDGGELADLSFGQHGEEVLVEVSEVPD